MSTAFADSKPRLAPLRQLPPAALPTVLGAVLLKGVQDVLLGELPDGWTGPFLVGTLAALGSGLLAIEWLLGYVRRHTYGVFVV